MQGMNQLELKLKVVCVLHFVEPTSFAFGATGGSLPISSPGNVILQ